jgi:pimeloyl-ACP methyl ester carboxylesterase
LLHGLTSACNTPSTSPAVVPDAATVLDAQSDAPVATRCDAGPTVVKLVTSDGIALEAELTTTGRPAGPAVILLHMIPPTNNRTNYATSIVSALVAKGISVLNVDRRGAGGSEGVAKDAYLGPKGALDAKAAVDFLGAHACAFDRARIGIVGASNGTTTAVDYAVSAAVAPRALVFLTGGTYTEAQTKISSQRAKLDPIPILFVYSSAESAWSAGFATAPSAKWAFKEYANGDHGTRIFTAAPASIDDVSAFLATNL